MPRSTLTASGNRGSRGARIQEAVNVLLGMFCSGPVDEAVAQSQLLIGEWMQSRSTETP